MTRILHSKAFKSAASAVTAAVLALVMVFTLSFSPATSAAAYADSASTIVTLGADLTDEQRETVLEFFGLTEDDLDEMQVIEVTNEDEREYLEGTLDDSIIGYVTLSCSYIQITDSGGINVETANLTYVTSSTIYNALQTAGIENCEVVVTAPYDVSGTGALTGIFMAFEASGEELDEDKKEAATEELVVTAELEDEYGEEVAEVISDVKDEVNSSDEDLSSEEISDLVDETATEYEISLSDESLETITELIETIQDLDYDVNAFSETLADATEEASGIWASIVSFFESIGEFFQNLFASITGNETSSSIFDNLDTSVFELDSSDDDEDESEEEEAEEAESESDSDDGESSASEESTSETDEDEATTSEDSTSSDASTTSDDSSASSDASTSEDATSSSDAGDTDASTSEDASASDETAATGDSSTDGAASTDDAESADTATDEAA